MQSTPSQSFATSCPTGAPGASAPLSALCLIARLHHVAAEPVHLAHQLGWPPSFEPQPDDLLLAAQHLGLKAKRSRSTADRLALTPLPALATINDGQGSTRTVVLAQCDGQRVLFLDPAGGGPSRPAQPTIEPLEVFAAQWSGELVLITSRASLAGELAKFDFSWFIPAIVKYRRLLGEVLIVSLFLQLFALVSPLFFQVVMDKVLVHRGQTTLDVLVIGLLVVTVFESALTVLRSYVFSHTTSRIDVELGARLFRHLVNLPLSYFQARRVGDSVARVRELENIRSFLTGNAITLVLDVAFSLVFIGVMFAYSVPLTLIVLASLPLYAGISIVLVPILRARLNEKFARGAENQALLVETITGIQTVKASALEPVLAKRWDEQLAGYVVNVSTDVITEKAGEGTETVQSVVSWTLSTYLENLTLTGSTAINGTGNASANILIGNSAVNTLTGAEGSDIYDGGAGNDVLSDTSTSSSDTYRWGLGMGTDTITDKGGSLDHVDLFAGITKAQLKFAQNAGNLELSVIGQSDKLVISNWYTSSSNQIEEFRLSDGSKVLASEVQSLISAMASFSAPSDGMMTTGQVAPGMQTLSITAPQQLMAA